MFESLSTAKRLLMEVDFKPYQGDRFQPTGFPDIGAATYQTPGGTRMLLIESVESMANRLENTIVGPDNELVPDLAGIPYIRVRLTGEANTATNSLIEAHRINSPWIISNDRFKEMFVEASAYKLNSPLNWKMIAGALFKYDINSIIHGVFLANLGDGRVKVARALSAFIEGTNVAEAVSGGVKFNPIDPSGKLRASNYDKDVYGNVPYSRVEYTAEKIKGYFNLDLGLLQSYGFSGDAYTLLVALSLYKVRAFLEGGTRLRTACDLKVEGDLVVTEPTGFVIPTRNDLLRMIKEKVTSCRSNFADPSVTELTTEGVLKKKEEKKDSSEEEESVQE